jgi:hypothetical protein
MFSQISRERAAFSLKLATLLGPHQAAPAPALDRGWTHLTSAMADRENMSVLEECERGEAFAATQYGDALLNPNMGNARELIESQSNLIAKSQLRMKSFRDKFNAKPVKQ